MKRGEIWWAQIPRPHGSEPGFRRPVLVVQADSFNQSRIRTVVAVMITSNLRLADAPGNVLLSTERSNLPKRSVVNVSQVVTLDKSRLAECVGTLPREELCAVERGVRLVLSL